MVCNIVVSMRILCGWCLLCHNMGVVEIQNLMKMKIALLETILLEKTGGTS